MAASRAGGVEEAVNIWGATVRVGDTYDVSVTELSRRRRANVRELQGFMFSEEQTWKPEETIGRISGDESWKRLRGEDGKEGQP